MEKLKDKTLALFFTGGVSLKSWDNSRNLEREVKIYNEFSKFFKNIYFFTYGDKEDLSYQDKFVDNLHIFIKKYNLPSKIYSFLLPFLYAKKIKESLILKTNQMNGSWAAVIAKKIYGGKLVVRCGFEWLRFCQFKNRAPFMLKIIWLLENISYKAADLIILPTREDKDFVIKTFGISESKIKILPNHIDTNLFKPMQLDKIKNRVVTVLRLEKQKNIFSLIEAVSDLPNIELVILGDGSLKKQLEEFSMKLGANVVFGGRVSQEKLVEEINKSQLFILPSFFEGSPKSLLEAMATGVPCIGTNVPGIKDVLIHKENGYLCETNSNSIKEAIRNLLSDSALQDKLGKNAREAINKEFSFKEIIKEELSALSNLI